MTNINYIEDCLEVFVGLQKSDFEFQPNSSDINFLQSVARQVFKNVPLTDRQHAILKDKLLAHKDQFEKYNIYLELYLNSLRMPLREIDRSKWIKIVDSPGNQVYPANDEGAWIAIRFVFSKKIIKKFDPLKREIKSHLYDSEEKIHYFRLTESNVYRVLSSLENSNFDVDPVLTDYYEKLIDMHKNKNNYIPGIYNYKLKNLNQKSIDFMIKTIGEPSKDNLALYKDRQHQLGLHHFDQEALDDSLSQLTTLAKKIVNRTKNNVLIKPSQYNFNCLAESILELDRFPLLVVLSQNNALNELHTVHNSLNGFIEPFESSVLFRLDNESNYEFNNYVKDYNLNSTVNKNTKVVYISNNKVPKPLVKNNWLPNTVLLMYSVRGTHGTDSYYNNSDLVIHYDDNMSQYMRFQRDGIEEL